MKIRNKLILSFLGVSLTSLAITNFLSYSNEVRTLTSQILNHLESVAEIQHNRIKGIIAHNLERLALVASRTQLRLSLEQYIATNKGEHQTMMNRILEDAEESILDFKKIFLATLDGMVVASTDETMIGQSSLGKEYFTHGMEGIKVDMLFFDQHDKLMLRLVGPLVLHERLLGVIIIEATAENIAAAISDYTGLGETGETILAKRDEKEDVVFVMPTRFNKQATFKFAIPKEKDLTPVVQSTGGIEREISDAVDYRGVPVLAATRYVEETGWGLVVKIDKDEAFAPLVQMRTVFVLVAAFSTLTVILVSLYLARGIAMPLVKLTEKAKNMMGARMVPGGGMELRDEVGILTQAFNEMIADLINTQSALEEKVKELEVEIEERKRAEGEKAHLESQLRQVQKMEAIGTLAGGIAHDFNNILTPILGYAELAQSKILPQDSAQNDLGEIIKAAKRARDLVQQILSFSRQTGQEKKPIQIHLIVKEALKLLRAAIPANIEIRQSIDTSSAAVLADPTQIHQVLMNLCTNAAHAMRDKGGVLAVSLGHLEIEKSDRNVAAMNLTPGPYLKLEVSDTGHGMDRAVLERIFDPYFTTKGKGEGSGMGLAVVHGIIKSHGGHITVYSAPGKGTTFHLFLPRIVGGSQEMQMVLAEPLPRGDERILVVDDDEVIAQLEMEILENLGYRPTTETNSWEALEHFRRHPDEFDLVITDMNMPRMTGDRLAQGLLAVRADIPIILCTGFSELINEKKAKALGIRGYIMKPIITRDLAGIVRKVLDEGNKDGAQDSGNSC